MKKNTIALSLLIATTSAFAAASDATITYVNKSDSQAWLSIETQSASRVFLPVTEAGLIQADTNGEIDINASWFAEHKVTESTKIGIAFITENGNIQVCKNELMLNRPVIITLIGSENNPQKPRLRCEFTYPTENPDFLSYTFVNNESTTAELVVYNSYIGNWQNISPKVTTDRSVTDNDFHVSMIHPLLAQLKPTDVLPFAIRSTDSGRMYPCGTKGLAVNGKYTFSFTKNSCEFNKNISIN